MEFDTQQGETPNIIRISANIYAIVYSGSGDDGFLKTFGIADTGVITKPEIATLEFDTSKGKTPNIINVSGDVYAIVYSGNGDDGFLKTVEISGAGVVTKRKTKTTYMTPNTKTIWTTALSLTLKRVRTPTSSISLAMYSPSPIRVTGMTVS